MTSQQSSTRLRVQRAGSTEHYDGDWLSEIRRIGPENYYPKVEL